MWGYGSKTCSKNIDTLWTPLFTDCRRLEAIPQSNYKLKNYEQRRYWLALIKQKYGDFKLSAWHDMNTKWCYLLTDNFLINKTARLHGDSRTLRRGENLKFWCLLISLLFSRVGLGNLRSYRLISRINCSFIGHKKQILKLTNTFELIFFAEIDFIQMKYGRNL